MGKIVILDDLTINKIAAGEVIERPASVVKEMVENSIDAGSTKIVVETKHGGITYIKITDNGKGIEQSDVEMAFERHATSKIRSAKDLDTVSSMGFRGEALASIASVAKVTMKTISDNEDIGTKIVLESGDIISKEEIAYTKGTQIEVTDLFYNIPARYKFLKKDSTEQGYIFDTLTNIALIHPEISFKYINSGKVILQTNGTGKLIDVVFSIFGKDIAKAMIPCDYTYEGVHVFGLVGKPEIARSNRTKQIYFVNNRVIKDGTISQAIAQAYKGIIPIGKFGTVILGMEINNLDIDVNVHPAKLEVRFSDPNTVFQAIYHSVKNTLLKENLIAEVDTNLKDRNKKSFEERLEEKLKEKDKEKTSLFGRSRRNEDIEEYVENESQIKTNTLEDSMGFNKDGILEELKSLRNGLDNEIKTLKENENKKHFTYKPDKTLSALDFKLGQNKKPAEEIEEEKPVEEAPENVELIDDEKLRQDIELLNGQGSNLDDRLESINKNIEMLRNQLKEDEEEKEEIEEIEQEEEEQKEENIEGNEEDMSTIARQKINEKVDEYLTNAKQSKYDRYLDEYYKNKKEKYDKLLQEENELKEQSKDKKHVNIITSIDEDKKITDKLQEKSTNSIDEYLKNYKRMSKTIINDFGEDEEKENKDIENDMPVYDVDIGTQLKNDTLDVLAAYNKDKYLEMLEPTIKDRLNNIKKIDEKEFEKKQALEQKAKEQEQEQTKDTIHFEDVQNLPNDEIDDEDKTQQEIDEKQKKLDFLSAKISEIEEDPNKLNEDFKLKYEKMFGTKIKTEEEISREEKARKELEKQKGADLFKNISLFDDEPVGNKINYKFIGIFFNSYIAIEVEDEIYIIDQHAAHERINYEKVKENFYSDEEKDSQMMLMPDVIELTPKELDIAKDNWKMFEKAGFVIEEFGDNVVRLIGCPTMCMDLDTKNLFLEILDEINTVARTAKQEIEEKFIATIACKASVKAKMVLDYQEVIALIDSLLTLPNPFSCPHGRPTAIKMSKGEIEKKFSRT